MSGNAHPIRQTLVAGAIPLTLIGLAAALLQNAGLRADTDFTLAVSVDLVVTIPLVYYLYVRRTAIPVTTVVAVLIAGVLVGSSLLPTEDRALLDAVKAWGLPAIELGILGLTLYRARATLARLRALRRGDADFFDALVQVCRETLPRPLAMSLATEIAVFYYGFVTWRARRVRAGEFTYHRRSGTPALLGAFVLVVGVEAMALHLLLARWHTAVAWIVTASSLYAAVQCLGFAKSLARRPHVATETALHLHYGILKAVEVPYALLASVERTSRPLPAGALRGKLSPLGDLERHNVVLHLRTPAEAVGLYGRRQALRTIGLYVDEPDAFVHHLELAVRAQGYGGECAPVGAG